MVVERPNEMSAAQRLKKAAYPIVMKLSKLFGKNNKVRRNSTNQKSLTSPYERELVLNNGEKISLQKYRGKKLLLVNTASDCGYTGQFDALQKLAETYAGRLQLIGFPANDFKEQEKGSDSEIELFCRINYGVSFPLAKKSVVLKNKNQNDVFAWLTHAEFNGWNDEPPVWNFTKYLLSESGELLYVFEPSIDPFSSELIKAIEKT